MQQNPRLRVLYHARRSTTSASAEYLSSFSARDNSQINPGNGRKVPLTLPTLTSSSWVWNPSNRKRAPQRPLHGHAVASGKGAAVAETSAPERKGQDQSLPLASRAAVTALNSLSHWEDALKMLRDIQGQQPEITVYAIHYNVVLKLVGAAGRWDIAEELVGEMERQPESSGSRPDNFTFSTLISSCLRHNEFDLALRWIEQMASTPACIPDQVTYSTIINALSASGRPTEALRIFRKMCDLGWQIDGVTYGTVLKLFVRAKEYKEAEDLYRKLKQSGKVLDTRVYNEMLLASRNQANSHKAMEVLQDMRAAGVPACPLTQSLVLHSLAKARDVAGVLAHVEELTLAGELKTEGLTEAIGACRRGGLLGEARELFLTHCAPGGSHPSGADLHRAQGETGLVLQLVPENACLRHMLSVFAELGDVQGASGVQKELEERAGMPLDVQGYTNLVQGYAMGGHGAALKGVVVDMRARGLEADSYLSCLFLSLLTKAVGEQAEGPMAASTTTQEEELGPTNRIGIEDLLWCLEQLNADACWVLVTAIFQAVKSGSKTTTNVGELACDFIGSQQPKSQKVAANGLLDLLWAWGRLGDALDVWRTAEGLGLYSQVFPMALPAQESQRRRKVNSPPSKFELRHPLGQLDVRQLSVGAAHVALFVWLSRLVDAREKRQILPAEIVVSLGKGVFKRKKGAGGETAAAASATVSERIAATLESLSSPFKGSESQEGVLVASRQDVAHFLSTNWEERLLQGLSNSIM